MRTRAVFTMLLFFGIIGAIGVQDVKGKEFFSKPEDWNVRWVDADSTWLEKVAKWTQDFGDEIASAGNTVLSMLEENGFTLNKAYTFFTKTFKAKKDFDWKDIVNEDTAKKFDVIGKQVQANLEKAIFGHVKEAGRSLIDEEKANTKDKENEQKGDSKLQEEESMSEEEISELLENIQSGEQVNQFVGNLKDGLIKAISKLKITPESLKGDLTKAKEDLGELSKTLTKLYENGVPMEKLVGILQKVGLDVSPEQVVKEETLKAKKISSISPDSPHDEL